MVALAKAEIEEAIDCVPWPAWVERIEIEPMRDANDEDAIDVLVVVRSGEQPFSDGATLNDIAHEVIVAVRAAGIELWPFVRFVSADELTAA